MKRISILLTLMSAITILSCQKPEDGIGTDAQPPVLVSSTPQSGADGLIGSVHDITLTFDKYVVCPTAMHEEISIDNEAKIQSINADRKVVSIRLTDMAAGRTFTLSFPEGAVTGYNDNPAAAFSLTFTTKAETTMENVDIAPNLVTENPLSAAASVYSYMRQIYGSNTISGAIAQVAWNTKEAEWVSTNAGKTPAIAWFDYIHLAASGEGAWINYGDISVVKNWWDNNGLVGACWHWNVPKSEGDTEPNNFTASTNETSFRPTAALTPDTWENKFLIESLEKISGYLKQLQDAGIALIWRPLHEAAGNVYLYNGGTAWFWWGADGPEKYKELWIYVFNYFKDKGINNLIWVWTSQTSSDYDKDLEYYPGDEYVDIIGRDLYGTEESPVTAEGAAAQFKTLLQYWPNKMVALSELGSVPDMNAQWDAGAKWLFFMPWYDSDNDYTAEFAHEHATIDWWKTSFTSTAVVDKSQLPLEPFN